MVIKSKHSGPYIVTVDIETSPLKSYHWGLWDQNVSLDQIQDEWSILSFSAKWLHEKDIIYMDTSKNGIDKLRDDSKLLEELWKILDKADIVIAQNGKKFDVKKIKARMIMLKMKPFSPIKVIDTKIEADKHFGFTSKKLEWMTKHLTKLKKLKHKLFPGFELWTECLKNNKKAWEEMKEYNCVDTLATEELYLIMRPWIEGHPNVGIYTEAEDIVCPKCGSKHVQKRGKSYTQTGEYHRYQCTDCGGWSRSRYVTNTKEKRKSLLSN